MSLIFHKLQQNYEESMAFMDESRLVDKKHLYVYKFGRGEIKYPH
jgi:hypothetical protein